MKTGTRLNYPKPTLHKQKKKEKIKLFGQTHSLNQEKKWLGKTKKYP